MLIIPGALGILLALAGFTQISMTMPYWQVLGLHTLLMVSLAAAFTPVFTLGLGALPEHLYPHGSSMLGTLQQVSAALGTALVVTVMAGRADSRVAAGVPAALAQLDGMRLAFVLSGALALVMVGIAFLLPKRPAAPEAAAALDASGTAAREPEKAELVLEPAC